MNLTLALVLAVLAVYRLAHMAAYEDGPLDLLARWREFVGQESWIGRGFHCVLCMSFWLSMLPAGLLASDWREFALLWLGTAGAVLIVQKVIYG